MFHQGKSKRMLDYLLTAQSNFHGKGLHNVYQKMDEYLQIYHHNNDLYIFPFPVDQQALLYPKHHQNIMVKGIYECIYF